MQIQGGRTKKVYFLLHNLTSRNPNELGIPLDYYSGIDDMHFNFFIKLLEKRTVPAMVLEWGNHRDLDRVLEVAFQLATGKKKPPQVYQRNNESLQQLLSQHKSYVIYQSEQDILRDYTLLKETGKIDTNASDIFVSQKIMKRDASFKEVATQYNLSIHANEYKRVILWHLSQWRNVHFFKND